MPEQTLSSMHGARDAEDRRLLEAGDHKRLLANYFHLVRERCFLRLRGADAADDATQEVLLRLLSELERGRVYPVPFRVVVWMVTEWTLRGLYPGAKYDGELPESWDPEAPDAFGQWADLQSFVSLIADLPEGQRKVAFLRWGLGLEPAEIALKLRIEPNAVYQRQFNALRTLAEKLSG